MDEYESLIGAYALDALDEDERRELESHLAACDNCRAELRAYRESAAALAYMPAPAEPPAALRERIVRAAREESATPLRRRPIVFAVPAAAALAAAAVVAFVLVGRGPDTSWVRTSTNRVALSGGPGAVVLAGEKGALLTSLAPAPAGRTYEAWVIRDGRPEAAGTFRSGGGPVVLTAPVRHGDVVAVTVEPRGGSPAPTSKPILTATI